MAKAIVTIPGVIGGLFGILIGGLELLWFIISAVSSHIPRSWIEGNIISPETGACIFILLGMIGAVSSLLYPVKKMNLGWVIILCGLAGFPVGYASGSYTNMGWTGWIIPGVLLTAAGIMSLTGPDRIASSLPLLNSDNNQTKFLGRILYSMLFAGVMILIMIGLLFIGSVPDTSPQGVATQDERDLESAGVSQSMGLYNESLPFYDKVIARNQSNFIAWYYKGTTLSKMGRNDEAIACFDRALEIKPDYKAAEDARKEALRKQNRAA
ncbi:MAG: tetratricopeptide repeat protein [Methanothrix sp.]|nr:tetratricopeptide repeat protein [Methanothrix sp.]MDD4446996.1 tetratricopeptide repeat protein [Methanothrix sp.]